MWFNAVGLSLLGNDVINQDGGCSLRISGLDCYSFREAPLWRSEFYVIKWQEVSIYWGLQYEYFF